MGRFREYYRKSTFGEYAKETLASGIGTIIGSVQDSPVKIITIPLHIPFPLLIASSFILADWVSMLIHISPAHKLFHVFDLNIVRVYGFNVAEKMFGQSPAVRVTRLATLSFTEVRTFKAGP